MAKMSLNVEPVYSGYSSDANWNCSVITLPVGMKSTSRIAASYVLVPAAAFRSRSLFGPEVLVDVLALRFGSPLRLRVVRRPARGEDDPAVRRRAPGRDAVAAADRSPRIATSPE
jgi:hypothetical protein